MKTIFMTANKHACWFFIVVTVLLASSCEEEKPIASCEDLVRALGVKASCDPIDGDRWALYFHESVLFEQKSQYRSRLQTILERQGWQLHREGKQLEINDVEYLPDGWMKMSKGQRTCIFWSAMYADSKNHYLNVMISHFDPPTDYASVLIYLENRESIQGVRPYLGEDDFVSLE